MTDTVMRMIETNPNVPLAEAEVLAACVRACFTCAEACESCADACLGEEEVRDLLGCIRTNLDCADVCVATGRVLSRQLGPDPVLLQAQLRACALACRLCATECESHPHHEHCMVCAEVCRACEMWCERLLGAPAA